MCDISKYLITVPSSIRVQCTVIKNAANDGVDEELPVEDAYTDYLDPPGNRW